MNEITITPLSTKPINSMFEQSFSRQQQHLMAAKKSVDPSLIALLKDIKVKHQNIKYKSYRLAAEFSELKRIFRTKHIPFNVVDGVFRQHRLQFGDNISFLKSDEKLAAIIHDIVFAAEKLGHFNQILDFNVQQTTENLANFIWHVFDCSQSHTISFVELKQTFLFLCQSNTTETIGKEHFLLWCDHNNSITRYRFQELLKIWMKLFALFDNNCCNFNDNFIPETVNECFEQCPGIGGLNEYQFTCLWQQNPQSSLPMNFSIFIEIFAIIKRLGDSENLIHHFQCISCLEPSIAGIRFTCQQCRKLSLCFQCFCMGYTNRKHNPTTHQMFENCGKEISRNKFWTFLNKLCNIFIQRNNENDVDTNVKIETNTTSINFEDDLTKNATKYETIKVKRRCSTNIDSLGTIVETLSTEKEKIMTLIIRGSSFSSHGHADIEFLRNHHNILTNAIAQLQDICRSMSTIFPQSSTPYRNGVNNQIDFGSAITSSVRGSDVSKTFFENNKSDVSIGDMSSWFHTKRLQSNGRDYRESLPTVSEQNSTIETELDNFKDLLKIVRNIIEDSHSDITELSRATGQLEAVLNTIIDEEEKKRKQ